MKIGQRIKQLREQKGWYQKELAKKLGVSPDAVSMWETGLRDPRSHHRRKLCQVFGITESELFEETPLSAKKLSPEILAALEDPVAVKALLLTHKNSQDIKNTIRSLLETLPELSPEKRQAILALCR